jgi:hypothetical protein
MGLIAGEMNLGVYQDRDGRYRWRLWSGLRLLAISGESFDDRSTPSSLRSASKSTRTTLLMTFSPLTGPGTGRHATAAVSGWR